MYGEETQARLSAHMSLTLPPLGLSLQMRSVYFLVLVALVAAVLLVPVTASLYPKHRVAGAGVLSVTARTRGDGKRRARCSRRHSRYSLTRVRLFVSSHAAGPAPGSRAAGHRAAAAAPAGPPPSPGNRMAPPPPAPRTYTGGPSSVVYACQKAVWDRRDTQRTAFISKPKWTKATPIATIQAETRTAMARIDSLVVREQLHVVRCHC